MVPVECDAAPLDAQHPAFSLFTNGPKGDPVKIITPNCRLHGAGISFFKMDL